MIVAKTEWDDNVLAAIYYKDLQNPIKNELLKEDTLKDMEEIVKKAIKIDGYLEERRIEKKNQNFI